MWFKTFSENWVHPLLENKKFVLVILAMFLPLAGYDLYQLVGDPLPQDKAIPEIAPKLLTQHQESQKPAISNPIDCSKELTSLIAEYNKHSETHN